MERDDLRATLGDLAAHVEDADGDALSVVRDRGRRRRRRRPGAITSIASALLVVIVLIGAAIAGHNQSPGRISTGPPPTPSTRTHPTTASGVCTVGDLQSHGRAPMPRAERVTKTEVSTGAELEPPESTGSPVRVSPASVWQRAEVALTPTTTYQLLLAVYTGPYPSPTPRPQVDEVLAWVVVRRHYPIDVRARSFVPPLGTGSVAPPPCFFGTQYDVFDARTGRHLATSVNDD
jgi:hypothetical protein